MPIVRYWPTTARLGIIWGFVIHAPSFIEHISISGQYDDRRSTGHNVSVPRLFLCVPFAEPILLALQFFSAQEAKRTTREKNPLNIFIDTPRSPASPVSVGCNALPVILSVEYILRQ
jgi:hypothetical protein